MLVFKPDLQYYIKNQKLFQHRIEYYFEYFFELFVKNAELCLEYGRKNCQFELLGGTENEY